VWCGNTCLNINSGCFFWMFHLRQCDYGGERPATTDHKGRKNTCTWCMVIRISVTCIEKAVRSETRPDKGTWTLVLWGNNFRWANFQLYYISHARTTEMMMSSLCRCAICMTSLLDCMHRRWVFTSSMMSCILATTIFFFAILLEAQKSLSLWSVVHIS